VAVACIQVLLSLCSNNDADSDFSSTMLIACGGSSDEPGWLSLFSIVHLFSLWILWSQRSLSLGINVKGSLEEMF